MQLLKVCLFVSLLWSSLLAATIRVPQDQPTIQAGIDAAVNGDTVLVGPGVWVENIAFGGKAIVLRSANGSNSTSIESAQEGLAIVTFDQAEDTLSVIEGFTIQNSIDAWGINIQSASPIIQDCIITGCTWSGDGGAIHFVSSAAKIRRNQIFGNSGEATGGGIGGSGITARYLEISENEIFQNESPNGPGIGVPPGGIRARIERNLIYENSGGGFVAGGIYIYSGENCQIINNTITGNSKGISLYSGTGNSLMNNIIESNVAEGIQYPSGAATISFNDVWNNGLGNYLGTDGISVDPLYVDRTQHDFHLTGGSPCIDAGDPSIIYFDSDGSRNDIGALSFETREYPIASQISYGSGSSGFTVHTLTPLIYWAYTDTAATTQSEYEIEVGTDTDWAIAEMWQPGPQQTSDSNVTYSGLPLMDHNQYHLRLRVNDGSKWGGWTHSAFSVAVYGVVRIPQDQPTIQAGINIAEEGDTILVGPGEWIENISFSTKNVALISESGREVTEIIAALTNMHVISIDGGQDTTSRVQGFTIRGTSDAFGIYVNEADPIISDCEIRNCTHTSGDGAGVFMRLSAGRIANCLIHHNQGGNTGGGIAASSRPGKRLTIERNVIFSNSSPHGPGIGCPGVINVDIVHNLIYSNLGTAAQAAGIYITGSNCTIYNNTVVGNTKGIILYTDLATDVRNNIVAYNNLDGFFLANATSEYNCTWANGTNNTPGFHGINANPLFTNLTTDSLSLQASSPCIDAGDPNPIYNDPDGSRNDIGAMPFTSTANRVLAVPSEYPTIQSAIDAASDGDTVLVADGTYHERISYKSKALVVTSHYVMDGDTIHVLNTVIDGDTTGLPNEDTTSVVRVVNVSSESETAPVIMGFTVKNGPSFGLLCSSANLIVEKCELRNNGVYKANGSVFMNHCRLLNCGILLRGGINLKGSNVGGDIVRDTGPASVYADSCSLKSILFEYSGSVQANHCIIDGNITGQSADRHLNNCIVTGDVYVRDNGMLADSCQFGTITIGTEGGCVVYRSVVKRHVKANPSNLAPYFRFYQCTLLDSIYAPNGGSNSLTLDSCNIRMPSPLNLGEQWGNVQIRCSNMYVNGSAWFIGDPGAGFDTANVTSRDPLFCDTASGNYTIRDSSPCAPLNNSCGTLIGAYGIGCANTAPALTSSETVDAYSGLPFSYQPTATDADGPSLSYAFPNRPSWLIATADSVYGTPPLTDADTSFLLIVSDGFLADSQIVEIKLTETPLLSGLRVEGDSLPLHVLSHVPTIGWQYRDLIGTHPQTQYEIAVGSDSNWSYAELWNPAPFAGTDSLIVYSGAALLDGHTYWLRARLRNDLLWSNWKQTMFRLNSLPTIPTPLSPIGAVAVSSTQPTFVIRNSSDAENDSLHYIFEISSDSTMTGAHVFEKTADSDTITSALVDIVLDEDAKYFWRVRASDYYEQSGYSAVGSFWVNSANSAPSAFDLTSPPNTMTPPLATKSPTLDWTTAGDLDPLDHVTYTLHLAIDSNFAFVNQIPGLDSSRYTPPTPLEWGTRYWWKVRALDLHGGETWSSQVYRFRIMTPGDANGNGSVSISDVVFLINYIFARGEAPSPLSCGDANCSGSISISDAVYLINYIFAGGAAPCEG